MKIHNTEINKKNFWIPFWIFSIIPSLAYYYIYSCKFLFFNLFTLFFIIIVALISVFFIIKRLLSENPKKVFYLELPILIIVYYLLSKLPLLLLIGVTHVGFSDLISLYVASSMLISVFFVAIWPALLITFLYYYYKIIILNKKIISHKLN